ncbi:hypothetical protein KEM54_004267, partial [Ascosphaera aggregata]
KTASISSTSFSRLSTSADASASASADASASAALPPTSSITRLLDSTSILHSTGSERTRKCHRKRPSVNESAAAASSNISPSDPAYRDSLDSGYRSSFSIDEAAWNRAVQRREVLKEFLITESTYAI